MEKLRFDLCNGSTSEVTCSQCTSRVSFKHINLAFISFLLLLYVEWGWNKLSWNEDQLDIKPTLSRRDCNFSSLQITFRFLSIHQQQLRYKFSDYKCFSCTVSPALQLDSREGHFSYKTIIPTSANTRNLREKSVILMTWNYYYIYEKNTSI